MMSGGVAEGNESFTDVNDSDWYKNAVVWAVTSGITKGVSESEFAPNERITREQMAVMIYRTMQYQNQLQENQDSVEQFADDTAISDYAKEAVYKMRELDIISGVGDNQFMPKGVCSRAMAFKVIAEAFCN